MCAQRLSASSIELCDSPRVWNASSRWRRLLAWFNQIDTDRGGTLSVAELQRALALAGLNYSGKFVNSLINMVDMDCSGSLSPPEFLAVHQHLRTAYTMFVQSDVDRSGILTINEVAPALQRLGFNLDMSPTGSFYTLLKSFDFDKCAAPAPDTTPHRPTSARYLPPPCHHARPHQPASTWAPIDLALRSMSTPLRTRLPGPGPAASRRTYSSPCMCSC